MERQSVACDTKSVGARAFQRNEPVPPSRCCWSLHHTTTPNSSLLSSGSTLRRERDRDTQRFGRFGTTSTHLRGLAICLGRKDPASKSPRVCGTVLFLTLYICYRYHTHSLCFVCVRCPYARPHASWNLTLRAKKCEIPHSWCQIDVPIGPFVCRLDRRLACQPVPLTLVDESAFPGIQPDRQYVTVSYILCELGMLNMYPKEYLALLRILYK